MPREKLNFHRIAHRLRTADTWTPKPIKRNKLVGGERPTAGLNTEELNRQRRVMQNLRNQTLRERRRASSLGLPPESLHHRTASSRAGTNYGRPLIRPYPSTEPTTLEGRGQRASGVRDSVSGGAAQSQSASSRGSWVRRGARTSPFEPDRMSRPGGAARDRLGMMGGRGVGQSNKLGAGINESPISAMAGSSKERSLIATTRNLNSRIRLTQAGFFALAIGQMARKESALLNERAEKQGHPGGWFGMNHAQGARWWVENNKPGFEGALGRGGTVVGRSVSNAFKDLILGGAMAFWDIAAASPGMSLPHMKWLDMDLVMGHASHWLADFSARLDGDSYMSEALQLQKASAARQRSFRNQYHKFMKDVAAEVTDSFIDVPHEQVMDELTKVVNTKVKNFHRYVGDPRNNPAETVFPDLGTKD